jgi:HSP20 family molecular chaperone IbpA
MLRVLEELEQDYTSPAAVVMHVAPIAAPSSRSSVHPFSIDVKETEEEFRLAADLPGVNK